MFAVLMAASLPPLPWAVPVVVTSHEAPTGATITADVTVDMTATGKAMGSVEARMTFDPGVVAYLAASQGAFQGFFELNTDSVADGVLVFAGINTDDTKNTGSVLVFQVDFLVVGDFGTSTPLALEVRDLTATDFTSLLGEVVVTDGLVEAKPGALELGIRPQDGCVPVVESRPYGLRALLDETQATIGAYAGQLFLDPAVVVVDSIVASAYGGLVSSNLAILGDSGYVRFAGANAEPPAADSIDLFYAYLRGVGALGEQSTVDASLDGLTDASQVSDILPYVLAISGGVATVRPGRWGDASLSWSEEPPPANELSATDALICLSGVVGKDISQFDYEACDVVPDDGANYTGLVTSLDALVILSRVVGKDTSQFRAGDLRC